MNRAAAPVRTHPAQIGGAWVRAELPRVLPPEWSLHDEGEDGARYVNRQDGQVVILSGATEQDGRRWLHLSCSGRTGPPSWWVLRRVKDIFLGRHRYAYQVLPPDSDYVNIHPNVLHLWHCLDEDPLPDFTQGSRSL